MHDYQNVCCLHCLWTEEKHVKSDDFVYEKRRKQLGRGSGAYCNINLIWKENHQPLWKHKGNSLGKLINLIRNLNQLEELVAYIAVI